MNRSLTLVLYPDELTLFRLSKDDAIPSSVLSLKFFTVSRTLEELSILIPTVNADLVRAEALSSDLKVESGWVAMKVDGVLDFGLVGILSNIVYPLKEAGIPVFVVSTYDTDYVLVKAAEKERTKACLDDAGHKVTQSQESFL